MYWLIQLPRKAESGKQIIWIRGHQVEEMRSGYEKQTPGASVNSPLIPEFAQLAEGFGQSIALLAKITEDLLGPMAPPLGHQPEPQSQGQLATQLTRLRAAEQSLSLLVQQLSQL